MATASLIPVSEYLRTTYRPDCDYIDGELEERSMGERPHARLQLIVGTIFEVHSGPWHVIAMTEQRVQVNSTRYRIPDICVVRVHRSRTTPSSSFRRLLCIEIVSSEDRFSRLQERVNDFASMGIEHIWVIDPWERASLLRFPARLYTTGRRDASRRRHTNRHQPCRSLYATRQNRQPRRTLTVHEA